MVNYSPLVYSPLCRE